MSDVRVQIFTRRGEKIGPGYTVSGTHFTADMLLDRRRCQINLANYPGAMRYDYPYPGGRIEIFYHEEEGQ